MDWSGVGFVCCAKCVECVRVCVWMVVWVGVEWCGVGWSGGVEWVGGGGVWRRRERGDEGEGRKGEEGRVLFRGVVQWQRLCSVVVSCVCEGVSCCG